MPHHSKPIDATEGSTVFVKDLSVEHVASNLVTGAEKGPDPARAAHQATKDGGDNSTDGPCHATNVLDGDPSSAHRYRLSLPCRGRRWSIPGGIHNGRCIRKHRRGRYGCGFGDGIRGRRYVWRRRRHGESFRKRNLIIMSRGGIRRRLCVPIGGRSRCFDGC